MSRNDDRRSGAPTKGRRAVLHDSLLLLRAVSGEQLTTLLGRSGLRAHLLRRLDERTALFPSDALRTLRDRLEKMKTPFHLAPLPAALPRARHNP